MNDDNLNRFKDDEKRLENLATDTVLTISARDYAEARNKKWSDYLYKGVEAIDERAYFRDKMTGPVLSARGGLAKLCEDLHGVAVVDVRPAVMPEISGSYQPHDRVYLFGTAMIPKENNKPELQLVAARR